MSDKQKIKDIMNLKLNPINPRATALYYMRGGKEILNKLNDIEKVKK